MVLRKPWVEANAWQAFEGLQDLGRERERWDFQPIIPDFLNIWVSGASVKLPPEQFRLVVYMSARDSGRAFNRIFQTL